jgi:hypothetical protein
VYHKRDGSLGNLSVFEKSVGIDIVKALISQNKTCKQVTAELLRTLVRMSVNITVHGNTVL